MPSDLHISEIAGSSGLGLDLFIFIFSLVRTILAAVITYYGVWQTQQRQQKLIGQGHIITGDIRAIRAFNDDDSFTVELEVRLSEPGTSRTIIGKRRYICDHLRQGPLPAIGTSVSILYFDERTWEVL